jgi:hypothetical protein
VWLHAICHACPRPRAIQPATDFHFPYPFRPGSVIPITTAELTRLKSAYPDPRKTNPSMIAITDPIH